MCPNELMTNIGSLGQIGFVAKAWTEGGGGGRGGRRGVKIKPHSGATTQKHRADELTSSFTKSQITPRSKVATADGSVPLLPSFN